MRKPLICFAPFPGEGIVMRRRLCFVLVILVNNMLSVNPKHQKQ